MNASAPTGAPTGAPAGAAAASGPVRRPPGRPRSERAERAIVEATLALLAEHGVEGLSIEAVAARAGVGKATIYRRWPRKEALVVDALARLTEIARPVSTGNVRDDLVTHLDLLRRRSTDTVAGRILPRVLSAGADHPEIAALYREQVVAPRLERIAEVLRGGQAAGQVRTDVDLDLVIDMLVGPVLARRWMPRPGARPLTHRHVAQIVDGVLAALRVG